MKILAFDTATAATTVALVDTQTGDEFECRDDPAPGARPGHAQKLLELIEQVLTAAGAGWDQIDRIAVGRGPGTFTGMRIGIATAQALAQTTDAQLVGVSTLASLKHGAHAVLGEDAQVLAVIDARRNEAFVSGAGLEPCVLTPAALGGVAGSRSASSESPTGHGPSASGLVAIGDGAIKFRDVLTDAGANVPGEDSPLHRVSAIQHCRLAAAAVPLAATIVEPEYLRVPDAELTK